MVIIFVFTGFVNDMTATYIFAVHYKFTIIKNKAIY